MTKTGGAGEHMSPAHPYITKYFGSAFTYSGKRFDAIATCGPFKNLKHDGEMAIWCKDNCEGQFGPGFSHFYFELEKDALMFLMRFG